MSWTSRDAADRAAERFRTDPEGGMLLSAIELSYFAHFEGPNLPDLTRLAVAPVIEVAAYAVQDSTAMRELQGQMHRSLDHIEGTFHRGRGESEQGDFLDAIGWQSPVLPPAALGTIKARAPISLDRTALACSRRVCSPRRLRLSSVSYAR